MATLANRLSSANRIRDGEPSFFANEALLILQLQYRIDPDGEYDFSYRKAAQSIALGAPILGGGPLQAQWSPIVAKDQFDPSLDIVIEDRDTVVIVDTFGPHLSWSLINDAITTLDDGSNLYGELRYWDGSSWARREDFDPGKTCRRIRFKARFNAAAPTPESHKFSYNVRLRDPQGNLVDYEIDPDIKNPSV